MLRTYQKRLIAAALIALTACPAALAARFIDTSGNWAETYVNILSDKGVIAPESDGKFKPDEPISRAVLAAWMVKILGLENQPVPATPSFPDVKSTDWFFRDVEIIRQNNYISGYADGFRPNQFIQKGEVISIIARALNRAAPDETQIEDELSKYKDASKVPAWARVGVAESSLVGILLVGPDTKSIGADKLATRADATALLYKLDEYLARRDGVDAVRQATGGRLPPQANGAPVYGQPPPGSAGGQPPTGIAVGQPPASGAPGYGQAPPTAGGDYFGAQSQVSAPHFQYGSAYPPPPSYGTPSPSAPPQSGIASFGVRPPAGTAPLQGGVIVLAAGTRFRVELKNTLSSGSTQKGEEIRATINEPIYANGTEVIPAGSRLVGEAVSVTSAHRFHAGANGKMDIKFTSIETPDGRKIQLSASVDEAEQRMTGGTTAGRVGKGLVTTGVGAASGAVLGTALGAIVGGTSGGDMGSAVGMGAVFGTALGAGVGGVGALVRKGSEVKLTAGSFLPLKLDDSMTVQLPQFSTSNQYPRRN
jgi:hypothetical protein